MTTNMNTNATIIIAPAGLTRHQLSEVWGDLSNEEMGGLRDSVRASNGVRVPILISITGAVVYDGWHRLRASELEGLPCPALDVDGWDMADVVTAVMDANRHRRHQDRYQLAKSAAKTRLLMGSDLTVEAEAHTLGYKSKRQFQNVLADARAELGLVPPPGRRRPEGEGEGEDNDTEAVDLDEMLAMASDRTEAQEKVSGDRRVRLVTDLVASLADLRSLWPGSEEVTAQIEAAIRSLGGQVPAPARDSLIALARRDREAAVRRFVVGS